MQHSRAIDTAARIAQCEVELPWFSPFSSAATGALPAAGSLRAHLRYQVLQI